MVSHVDVGNLHSIDHVVDLQRCTQSYVNVDVGIMIYIMLQDGYGGHERGYDSMGGEEERGPMRK
jgi:hypothetical protein